MQICYDIQSTEYLVSWEFCKSQLGEFGLEITNLAKWTKKDLTQSDEYSRRKYSELLVLLLRIESYENSRLYSSRAHQEQYKSGLNTTISKSVVH